MVDAILTAAKLLVVKHGVDGLTTNVVDRLAGVSIGSLYQYFPGKRALLTELRKRHQQLGEQVFRAEAVAMFNQPVAVAARRLVERMIEVHREEPELRLRQLRHPCRRRPLPRGGVRVHPGGDDGELRLPDPRQVVPLRLDPRPPGPEPLDILGRPSRPRIGGVDGEPLAAEEPGRGDAAPPQADHRDLAPVGAPGVESAHRTFRVPSAIRAQRMPRM